MVLFVLVRRLMSDCAHVGGGLLSGISSMFSSNPKAPTLQDKFEESMAYANGSSSMESITTGAWKALGGQNMQGVTTCFPADGKELYTAVTGPDCTVIMLTRNYFDSYHIEREMFVTGRKVIIGNPLTLPLLNTTKVERIFHGKVGLFLNKCYCPV